MLECVKSFMGSSCPIVAVSKISPELPILWAQECRALVKPDNFIGIPTIRVQVHEGSQGVVIFWVSSIPPHRRLNCIRRPLSKKPGAYRSSRTQIDKEQQTYQQANANRDGMPACVFQVHSPSRSMARITLSHCQVLQAASFHSFSARHKWKSEYQSSRRRRTPLLVAASSGKQKESSLVRTGPGARNYRGRRSCSIPGEWIRTVARTPDAARRWSHSPRSFGS